MEGLRELIARWLVTGRPPIRSTSREVAMSVRTLQRRLADRGWSYTELVDDVRRSVAQSRVADLQTPFKAVAMDLGFAEQASFTRAFRRWTGLTPRQYRRRWCRATGAPPVSSTAAAWVGRPGSP
jgi:AraC-like DNA-binding protein